MDGMDEGIILDNAINILKRQVISGPMLFLVMLCTTESMISCQAEIHASPAALSRGVNIFSEVDKLSKKYIILFTGAATG